MISCISYKVKYSSTEYVFSKHKLTRILWSNGSPEPTKSCVIAYLVITKFKFDHYLNVTMKMFQRLLAVCCIDFQVTKVCWMF
jgi:hypothetical protein